MSQAQNASRARRSSKNSSNWWAASAAVYPGAASLGPRGGGGAARPRSAASLAATESRGSDGITFALLGDGPAASTPRQRVLRPPPGGRYGVVGAAAGAPAAAPTTCTRRSLGWARRTRLTTSRLSQRETPGGRVARTSPA